MRIAPDALEKFVQQFWEDGWGIASLFNYHFPVHSNGLLQNIHCIGDRANKVALDIFERMLVAESKETGENILEVAHRRRPRIEHAQIMRQEDLVRAGKIGGASIVISRPKIVCHDP